jgi:hypothetical protein
MLSPAVYELLYAIKKHILGLNDKPCMHCFFHFLVTGETETSQSVSEWTKEVIDRRSQIRTIQGMLQHLKVQLAEAFNGVSVSVMTGTIMQLCDTLQQQSSAFGSNSWFQLVPKHLAITDTIYCCVPLYTVFKKLALVHP